MYGSMLWKGVRIDIQESLGEGSQGRVFKALRIDRETRLTQTVAVKILHSKTAVDLWKGEFESLQRVRSPYCVQVLSFERVYGRPALVLEYVDGVSLAELSRTWLLNDSDLAEVVAQIQIGLSDLHAQGTFHGDLNPHNVMVDRQGRVRLLDFGLANYAGSAPRLTPKFAAPERLRGEPASFAADLYSLGRLEQFLRDPNLTQPDSPTNDNLLAPDPGLRRPRTDGPCIARQLKLAEKIESLILRQQEIARARTRTHSQTVTSGRQTSRLKGHILTACVSLLCLATSRASQATRSHQALLAIRTYKWHYFLLDGAPVGYSPLTIGLPPGSTHRLQWISSEGRGERQLKIHDNQVLQLGDRDFSH